MRLPVGVLAAVVTDRSSALRGAFRWQSTVRSTSAQPWVEAGSAAQGPPAAAAVKPKEGTGTSGLFLDDLECARAVKALHKPLRDGTRYDKTERVTQDLKRKIADFRANGSQPAAAACFACMNIVGDVSVHCAKDFVEDYKANTRILSADPFRRFLEICAAHRAHASAHECLRWLREKSLPIRPADYELALDACKYSDDAVARALSLLREHGHEKYYDSWLVTVAVRASGSFNYASSLSVKHREMMSRKSLTALMGAAKRSREPGNADKVEAFGRSLGHRIRSVLYTNMWLTACKDAGDFDRAVEVYDEEVEEKDAITYALMINVFVAMSNRRLDDAYMRATQVFAAAEGASCLTPQAFTALMSLFAKFTPSADTEAVALRKKYERLYNRDLTAPLRAEYDVAISLTPRDSGKLVRVRNLR
ncbi:hypothetical protein DIPPA_18758 [Diplonema papillatum]|nr:hypothetical protein DIPPA_18758 [Diplonema papillatum]